MATTASAPAPGAAARLRAAGRGWAERYRALGEAPATRRLLGAAAASYVGDRFATVALVAASYDLGSTLGVGATFALIALPRVLVQAPAGTLVDRHPGKRLLIGALLATGAVTAGFVLLRAIPSLWLLYGLVLASATLLTVTRPAFEVRLMAVTPPAHLGTANAVHLLAMTCGELIGPFAGGLLLALAGTTPLFLFNAASFLIVAGIVASLPERVSEAAPTPAAESTSAAAEGYRTLLRRPEVALFCGSITLGSAALLAVYALFADRADDLGLGAGGVGIFFGTMGVGTLIGGVAAGGIPGTDRRALPLGVAAAAAGTLFLVLFGVAASLPLALAALVLFGLTNDLGEVLAVTSFQHRLPAALFGRFFALVLMASGVGGLVGALGGPLLAEEIGLGATLGLLVLPTIVLAVIFVVREGGFRFALPAPAAPTLEPEVAGHMLFGVPTPAEPLAPSGPMRDLRLRPLV